MKKTILSIVLALIATASLFANEPNPLIFELTNPSKTVTLSQISSSFTIDEPILGWHWGGCRLMTEAMEMNQTHVNAPWWSPFNDVDEFVDNANLFIGSQNNEYILSTGRGGAKLEAMALRFNPSLYIDDVDDYVDNPGDYLPENYEGPVFGFRYFHEDLIPDDPEEPLHLDASASYTGDLILSDPWPDFMMFWNNGLADQYKHEYNGEEWFLTVNLSCSSTYTSGSDPVLSFCMPTVINDDGELSNGSISFSGISNSSNSWQTITDDFGYSRGLTRESYTFSPSTTTFTITKDMLAPNSATFDNLHLCAFFKCNGDLIKGHNYFLNPKLGKSPSSETIYIDEVGLEMYYHGGVSLDVNWIRVETPHARKLFWGQEDYEIRESLEADLDYYTSSSFTQRGIKPVRFYSRDEGNPAYWEMQRYFNKLIDRNGTASEAQWYFDLYNTYVNPKDYWLSFAKLLNFTSVPYIKFSSDASDFRSMGFCKGYFFDSEETKIKYNNRLDENDFNEYDNLSTMNLDDYYTIVERAWCFQTTWERLMKDIFY